MATASSDCLIGTGLGKIPIRLSVTGQPPCLSYSSEVWLAAADFFPRFERAVRSPILIAGIPAHIS